MNKMNHSGHRAAQGASVERNTVEIASTVGALLLMLVTALYLAVPRFFPAVKTATDTEVSTGTHVTFIFIAPTNIFDGEFVATVKQSRDSVRAAARRAGYFFSTVGISDKVDVQEGVTMLDAFGPFDEINVGRNWLNSGIVEHINRPAARPTVPQLIVTLQEIAVDTTPHSYGERTELVRLVGGLEIRAWGRAGSRVTLNRER